MKKFFTYLLILFMTAGNVFADNYFTAGKNETLRIHPNDIGSTTDVTFRAHFDAYLDHWSLDFTFPKDSIMELVWIGRESNMNIPYTKIDGTDDTYNAPLTVSDDYSTFSSTTNCLGYWDTNNDGYYESYGTVKWGAGDHDDMFRLGIDIKTDCTGDSIVINGYLTSTYDWRGPIISGATFNKTIHLIIGYEKGDVDGDKNVTILDVSTLTDYLSINLAGMDQYQLDAADVNCDGVVSISDVGALIDM